MLPNLKIKSPSWPPMRYLTHSNRTQTVSRPCSRIYSTEVRRQNLKLSVIWAKALACNVLNISSLSTAAKCISTTSRQLGYSSSGKRRLKYRIRSSADGGKHSFSLFFPFKIDLNYTTNAINFFYRAMILI